MAVGSTAVQAIYGLSAASSVFLGYVVWQHRQKTGAKPLLVAIAAGWWWSTTLFLATLVSGFTLSVWLEKSIYPGVVVAVVAIFVLALEYTGREHLVTRWVIALLSVEPVAVIFLVVANPGDVFFDSFVRDSTSATGVYIEYGLGFGIHALYSYVLVFVAGAMILDLAYRTRTLYRGQLVALLGAVFAPLILNAVGIFRLVSFDITPLGIIVANALYTVAITRYRLIDLSPIARDRVVNNINDAVFVVDVDHRLVDVNPVGEELARTFVGDVEVIGENARALLEFVPEIGELYGDIVGGGTERSVEYSIGGGHYHAEATPIEDGRGRLVGWLFLVRDVTEQKRRERTLRERNEQLDKFASVVSHDLRNPLQVAGGRVELAMETGDTSHLEAVEGALDRMEDIIDDVLSLARSGDAVTDLKPLDLGSVAENAWENVETADAALRVPDDGRVTADRDRLVRLLENLFRNATEHGTLTDRPADATSVATETTASSLEVVESEGIGADGTGPDAADEASPAVTVEVGVVREGSDPIGFYVADDGPGIPPDEREAVLQSGYSTSAEGTGFGLTIVSQIAQAHGWEVDVGESETGGARFEVTGVELVGS